MIEFVPPEQLASLLPPPREREGFVPTLPPTLKSALADYVLASGALLYRSGRDEPCTMLIHTDMRRAMQNLLAPEVVAELALIRQRLALRTPDIPAAAGEALGRAASCA